MHLCSHDLAPATPDGGHCRCKKCRAKVWPSQNKYPDFAGDWKAYGQLIEFSMDQDWWRQCVDDVMSDLLIYRRLKVAPSSSGRPRGTVINFFLTPKLGAEGIARFHGWGKKDNKQKVGG